MYTKDPCTFPLHIGSVQPVSIVFPGYLYNSGYLLLVCPVHESLVGMKARREVGETLELSHSIGEICSQI